MKKIILWLILPLFLFIFLAIVALFSGYFLQQKWLKPNPLNFSPTENSQTSSPNLISFSKYQTPDNRLSFDYPASWLKISPATLMNSLPSVLKNQILGSQDELFFLALDKNIGQPVILMLLKRNILPAENKEDIWKDKGLSEDKITLLSKEEEANGYLINAQYQFSGLKNIKTLERYYFLENEGAVYELILMAPADLFETYQKLFNQIIDSAQFQ